ncbi:hypothetical protein JCM15765_26680 [Paradesulfitobacterium aromaticivorans]
MKKQLAIAVTLALLALPVNSAFALAETTTPTTTSTTTTTTATGTTTTTDTSVSTDTSATTTTPTDTTTLPVVDESGKTVDPGTLPDSPFYWLTGLIEKLQVILTFDAQEKTALMEKQALKKLAAAQEMAKQGKTEKAQKVMTEYVEKVEKAQAFLKEVKDPESDAYKKLESALANTSAKNIETLSTLLDKLPPQAAERAALNIVRSMDKAVDKMDKEEKAKVEKEFKKAAKAIDQEKLDEETKVALKNFQEALGVTGNSEGTDNEEQNKVMVQTKEKAQAGADKKAAGSTAAQVKTQKQEAGDVNKQEAGNMDKQEAGNMDKQEAGNMDKQEAGDVDKQEANNVDEQDKDQKDNQGVKDSSDNDKEKGSSGKGNSGRNKD